MINYKLKAIVNDLFYADDEKDLKVTLLRNLKDLMYENETIENYEELRNAFKTIAKVIDK